MFNFLNKFLNSSDKEVKRMLPVVEEVGRFEEVIKKLKDKDFAIKTEQLKKRLASGENLDDFLPEAFALVREASFRVNKERPFDVQVMGAMVLHEGKIAEQKTGEGKTLTASMPLYLNALSGKGVHLVTVNDYLARRDAGWMGAIFHLLGLSTSAIIHDSSFIFDLNFVDEKATDSRMRHLRSVSRKEAYAADITYGINSEFGFDYLRDNMARGLEDLVQRDFNFAIVDEVDSVLIDEARTPHIVSAPDMEPTQKYYEYAKVVEKLTPKLDFIVDEKMHTAHLTDHGIGKIEQLLGSKDIYEQDFGTVHHIEAALKAKTLYQKEKDYIVRENEVIIVDEFTGRLMPGRRWSEGIHQAVEAKEGVAIQQESKTLATISLQNYFRKYQKIAGMTGTAVTEAEEFHKIYKLEVVAIPTHRPMVRQDQADQVYKTQRAKYAAIVHEIEEMHKIGRPVLVGTTSIEKNEIISQFLKHKGIAHEILNAKQHEKEAMILANAGKKGAVTVATNMAGRGVDIILGGNNPPVAGHEEVVKLGGLHVIGTERHESRRIDNQLRGRAGRQGDPGSSRFFLALDDDIMRLFGGDQVSRLMTFFNIPEDQPLEHGMVSRAIEQAQSKVEQFNFDSRKHLLDYDDVMNKQREIIYNMRKKVLNSENLKQDILDKINKEIEMISSVEGFATIIPFDPASQEQMKKQPNLDFKKIAHEVYEQREKQIGAKMARYIEQQEMLRVLDTLWMEHLEAIDDLREGIGLRGYGQRDPLVEYKTEAFNMFEKLMAAIDNEIVHRIYKIAVAMPEVTNVANVTNVTGVTEKRPGRNDPCWCNSGKKYKKCHYPN
ncbi:preprotein translocase subunit SecA [Candidatus Gottesmanbacteria bacterium]|nr:preprotein translocase subunit SecA [Candidatus Gottesmanbacteria bacterium]